MDRFSVMSSFKKKVEKKIMDRFSGYKIFVRLKKNKNEYKLWINRDRHFFLPPAGEIWCEIH